ncbi:MAG: hypothetical protein PHY04_02820 [Candidatus ainarchaeum sp.]|jgi:hypothetical protein|nr:hypothetical protein [Candidatus ainarchaeum sp.]MDD3085999.1 hypothetical protein [Candidatus ainarchaeum sp.]MDD4128642.1 hypothetical protein [Candidatus ainarchaeum sp.]MDD4467960.1 hypothetical protein [Candidatus ainarchaeum sp.]HPM85849.1 hypothetical protein [archaeon]
MDITTGLLVEVSLLVIYFSIGVIIIVLGYLFLFKGKSLEEKKASSIIKKIEKLKKSNSFNENNSKVLSKNSLKDSSSKKIDFDKTESSLKNLLIKKFKPKIESQLGSKVNILEFNLVGDKFTALILITDIKILLSIDSSGKIIDYKKVK